MQHHPTENCIEEDEIDIKELFKTLNRYKYSIIITTIIITLLVATKVYFMPKYYQSSVMLEVKPQEEKGAGFSMGGAAALLLGGSASSTDLERDIALMKTFRTNKKVLEKSHDYMVRYFITNESHKEVELESNLSITVMDAKVNDYEFYGSRLLITPKSKTEYQLTLLKSLFSEDLGLHHYSEMVEYVDEESNRVLLSFMVQKNREFDQPITIELAGDMHYVYENIITKNLTIEADKKSPFLTIKYLDNLPQRGERYLKELIESYTQQSIEDIKEESRIVIDSYDQQIKKIEKEVQKSAKRLMEYKSNHGIIEPSLQATALVEEFSKVDIELAQNSYKKELIGNLIAFTKKHQNIDAIAPSLMDLGDEPTIKLIGMLQEQQLNLSTLLVKYKPNNPQVAATKEQVRSLRLKIISNLKNLQQTLKEKEIALNKMKEGYNKKLKLAPKQEQEIISFTRDYKVNEKLYLFLMQQRSAAQIKHDKALGKFKIIEEIYTPHKAAKPKKALIVAVAFISSLILMIFVAFFREFLRGDENENKSDKSRE